MTTATTIGPTTEHAARTFIAKVAARYDFAGAILLRNIEREGVRL